jgi:hypothetical protein
MYIGGKRVYGVSIKMIDISDIYNVSVHILSEGQITLTAGHFVAERSAWHISVVSLRPSVDGW